MRVNEGVGLQDSSRELTRGSLIFIVFHNLCGRTLTFIKKAISYRSVLGTTVD